MIQQPNTIAAPNNDEGEAGLEAFLKKARTPHAKVPVVQDPQAGQLLVAPVVVAPLPVDPQGAQGQLPVAPVVVAPLPLDPQVAQGQLPVPPVVLPLAPEEPVLVAPPVFQPLPEEPKRPIVSANQGAEVPPVVKDNKQPAAPAPVHSQGVESFLALTRTGDKTKASDFETYCTAQKIIPTEAFERNAARYTLALARIADDRLKQIFGWDLTTLNTETQKYAHLVRYLLDPSVNTLFDKDKFSQTKFQKDLTPTGATPLHIAALYADLDTMKALIRTGKYDMFTKDAKGLTPFHYLAVMGTAKDYKKAVTKFGANAYDAGMKVDPKDPGVTPVMIALRAGNTQFAKEFLNTERQNLIGNLLSAQDPSVNFYLYGAAKGPQETIDFLSDELAGGNINRAFGNDNVTVLMAAAHKGNIIASETTGEGKDQKIKITYAVEDFLGDGANSSAVNNEGYNAFEIAAKAGHLGVVKTLYAHKSSDYRQDVMARLIAAGEVKGKTSDWIQAEAVTTVRRVKHHDRDAKRAENTHSLYQPKLRINKEFDEELNKQETKAHQRAFLETKLKGIIEAYVPHAIDYLAEYNWDKTKTKADQGAIRKGWDWLRSYMYYFWNFGHNHTAALNKLTGGNDGKNIKDTLAAKADAEGKLQEFMTLLNVAEKDRVEAIEAGKVGWFAKKDGGSFSKRISVVHSQLTALYEEVESIKAEINSNVKVEGVIPADAPAVNLVPPVAAPVPQGPQQAPAVANPGHANGPALFAPQPAAAQHAAVVQQQQVQQVQAALPALEENLPPAVAMGN